MRKCFLDTNFFVYLLDETALFHKQAVAMFLRLAKDKTVCCISHQTAEEFLFIFAKLLKLKEEKNIIDQLSKAVDRIFSIPGLSIISPRHENESVYQVLAVMGKYQIKPADAYIIVTIIENKVSSLATFDEQLQRVARENDIEVF